MATKKLSTVYDRLISAGLDAEYITLYNVSGTGKSVPAIRINTDYSGPYPSRETWQKIDTIDKICGNNFRTERRGFYTAVFVWEV